MFQPLGLYETHKGVVKLRLRPCQPTPQREACYKVKTTSGKMGTFPFCHEKVTSRTVFLQALPSLSYTARPALLLYLPPWEKKTPMRSTPDSHHGGLSLLQHPPPHQSLLPTAGAARPDSRPAELCEAEEWKRPHGVAWTLTAALGASQQLSTHSPGLALFLESVMDSSSQA